LAFALALREGFGDAAMEILHGGAVRELQQLFNGCHRLILSRFGVGNRADTVKFDQVVCLQADSARDRAKARDALLRGQIDGADHTAIRLPEAFAVGAVNVAVLAEHADGWPPQI